MAAPWKAGPIGRVFPAVPRIIIERGRAGCALTHANIALMLTRHEMAVAVAVGCNEMAVAVGSERGGQGAATQEVVAFSAVDAVAATSATATPEIGASSELNLALSVGDDDARSSASDSSTFSAISTLSVSRLYNAHEYTHEPYDDEPMDAERGHGHDQGSSAGRANADRRAAYEEAVRFITQTEAEALQLERRRHVTGEGVYYYPRFDSVHEERRAQKAPRRSCIEIGSTVFVFGNVVCGMVTLTFLGNRVLRTHSGEFNARVVRHDDALVVVAVGQILVFREIVVDSSWMNDIIV